MKNNDYEQDSVNKIFSSISDKYDLMNSIMSLGLHQSWRREFVQHLPIILPGASNMVLDVASGTGDVASLMKKYKVVACDINMDMIKEGMRKMANRGSVDNIAWVQCSAEKLPFANSCFDACSIAFGMRNIENRDAAIAEFLRILKPGGKFICMEFSSVEYPLLQKAHKIFLHRVIPTIGEVVTNDREAYEYLADSISKFPCAEIFGQCIANLGFKSVSYKKIAFGAVAIHSGYKGY